MKFRKNHTTAAKLTPEQVLEMRERYVEEGWTQGALAREYKVSVGQVGRIVRGEAWIDYQQPQSDSELMHSNALKGVRSASAQEIAESEARLLAGTAEFTELPQEFRKHRPLSYAEARAQVVAEREAQSAKGLTRLEAEISTLAHRTLETEPLSEALESELNDLIGDSK